MAAVRDSAARRPVVAGMFYPADADECRRLARQYVFGKHEQNSVGATSMSPGARAIGGMVPHAGWICSGAIAGETIRELMGRAGDVDVDVVVVFGAVHTPIELDHAALDSHASWLEPGSETSVATEMRAKLIEAGELFAIDDEFHRREHAVEVELPLVREAWPKATLLPVEVPLIDDAIAIGKTVAQRVKDANVHAVFLASSDLTHYGPAYRFAPAGTGLAGLDWATQNDRRLLDRVQALVPEEVVSEVRHHQNACGGGAIAAMLSACREFGARQARVLTHANSYQTLAPVAPQTPDNAVGYASVVVESDLLPLPARERGPEATLF